MFKNGDDDYDLDEVFKFYVEWRNFENHDEFQNLVKFISVSYINLT